MCASAATDTHRAIVCLVCHCVLLGFLHIVANFQGGDEVLVLREKKDDQDTLLWSVLLSARLNALLKDAMIPVVP